MTKQGIMQTDKEFYHNILTDMNRNDILLSESYEEKEVIKKCLERVRTHQMKDFLSESEISNSRGWVIHRYFYEEHEILEPVYISLSRTQEFIQYAVKEIIVRLSENGCLPKMF
jgi:hypothetical protein